MTREECRLKTSIISKDAVFTMLYFPEQNRLVFFDMSGGDQLLPEDYKAGFNDYIDILSLEPDLLGKELLEDDGGIYMFDNTTMDSSQLTLSELLYDAISDWFHCCPDFIVLRSE